jgi:hypothetical protein
MEDEVRVNTHFRNDLAEWMEEQQHLESSIGPSFVFSSNMGEQNEAVLLCGPTTDTADHVKKWRWRKFQESV